MGTQIDTGLGWSADSAYLLDIPRYIGSITQAPTPDPALPLLQTISDPSEVQPYDCYWYRNIGSGGASVKYFIGYNTSDQSHSIGIFKTVNSGWYVYSYEDDFLPGGNMWAYTTAMGYSGVTWSNPLGTTLTLDATSGIYYGSMDRYTAGFDNDGTVKQYQTLRDALTALTPPATPYNKMNNGYSVTCFASWVTPEGTNLISPVLISTDPAASIVTSNGQTPSTGITTVDFLLDGLRFYMSFIGGISATTSSVQSPSVLVLPLEQYGAAFPQKVFKLLASSSYANIKVLTSPDPYGDNAEEEGGDGDDPEDDPVDEQTNPLPSVAGLGFCTVYVPSQSELLAMSSYLWSGSFDVDQVIKLFSNPLDSILGLSAVPVDLVGTSEQIYLGGVALTGVTMPRYTGRTAVKVDMGTVTIKERYGAYLDYDPYTEFAIYVPFVGIKNLKADDIMGKTLSLMYDIDILTGACVAYLRPSGGSVLYEWAGQCAQQIPVTSSNWDNIFRNAVTAASTLGTSLFAPASAPVLAGAVASAATQAIAAKPRVDRSGALTGVSGWLGQLRPYIIRTIPEAYIPVDQNKFIGYPAYINVTMSAISGYNEVASVHLEGIPATGNELAEIESLLKGGVIF